MRQAHPAGERMFVDYAGQTVDLIDGRTGEIRPAQIFVAVMGASNYTYAEATLTQTLPDWIGAHVRGLAFMGGVPAQLVPDNPKVGVTLRLDENRGSGQNRERDDLGMTERHHRNPHLGFRKTKVRLGLV